MSTPSPDLKHSELLNRLVLDRETVAEVGRVSRLLLDNQGLKIVGLTCKSGGLAGKQKTFSWKQIEAIGADSVIVTHHDLHTSDIPASVNPMVGSEVWTDTGNKVGKIVDFVFNVATGDVLKYMFSAHGLQGLMAGSYLLEPIMISSIGDKRVIVLEKAVKNAEKYTPGLGERIGKAAEFIKKDYERTQQDLQSVKQVYHKAVEQAQDGNKISSAEEVNIPELEPQLQEEKGNLPEKIQDTI